jgi:CxxC-x17-CxxC domain-containing protein
MYADRTITCADCGQQFVFSATEQSYFAERQLSEPRRCAPCRSARRSARSGGTDAGRGSRGPREMFSATCGSCGREALVPFRPTESRPVYCSDCFSRNRA